MATGRVKWFNGPSGFGVITADAGGGELFVHQGASWPPERRRRSVLVDDAAADSLRDTAVASRKEG